MLKPKRASSSRFHAMSTKRPPPLRSAKTLRVPRTPRRAPSTRAPIASIASRLPPVIFRPIGVRMPVVSIEVRASIGIVQAFETPGICSASSISRTSASREM